MEIKAKPDTKKKRNERQQKRRDRLNAIAHYLGYGSWSMFETAVLNGRYVIGSDPVVNEGVDDAKN